MQFMRFLQRRTVTVISGAATASTLAVLSLRHYAHSGIAHMVTTKACNDTGLTVEDRTATPPKSSSNETRKLPAGIEAALQHSNVVILAGQSLHVPPESCAFVVEPPTSKCKRVSISTLSESACKRWLEQQDNSLLARLAASVTYTPSAVREGLHRHVCHSAESATEGEDASATAQRETPPGVVYMRMPRNMQSTSTADMQLASLPTPVVIDATMCPIDCVESIAATLNAAVMFAASHGMQDNAKDANEPTEQLPEAQKVFLEEIVGDGCTQAWEAWFAATSLDHEQPSITFDATGATMRSFASDHNTQRASKLAQNELLSLRAISSLLCRGVLVLASRNGSVEYVAPSEEAKGANGAIIIPPSESHSIADTVESCNVALASSVSLSSARVQYSSTTSLLDELYQMKEVRQRLNALEEPVQQLERDILTLEGFLAGLHKRQYDASVKREDLLNAVLQAKAQFDAIKGRYSVLTRRHSELQNEERRTYASLEQLSQSH